MATFAQEGDRSDTEAAIMEATYSALCEHGYTDLTIQRIGDEFEKSKSLLYHHYDGKDDLLLDFLVSMLTGFEQAFESGEKQPEDPRESLELALDFALDPDPDAEHKDFGRAMAELRAQAAHDPDYREYFTRSDQVFRDQFAVIIADGIDADVFCEVDPHQVAEHVHSLLVGTMTRQATADDVDVSAVRAEVDAYVEARLLAE